MDLEDKRESLLEMGTMRMDREGAISDDHFKSDMEIDRESKGN